MTKIKNKTIYYTYMYTVKMLICVGSKARTLVAPIRIRAISWVLAIILV